MLGLPSGDFNWMRQVDLGTVAYTGADAPLPERHAALRRLWDDAEFFQACCAAALRHASRPDIAPERIVDDFLWHIQAHLDAVARRGGDRLPFYGAPASPRAA